MKKTYKTKYEYWRERCELAEKYISESPCDPDFTSGQWEAYNKWKQFKTK